MSIARHSALALALLFAPLLAGQPRSALPDPPKPDVPYLIHADTLLEPEITEAKEETRKDEQLYAIRGAASSVKTPLASPEFLFQSDTIAPDKLQLYKLDSKNGRREVVTLRKKKTVAKPIQVTVFPVRGKIYRLRVDDSLPPGEYSLSPDGSNAVFCFAIQ